MISLSVVSASGSACHHRGTLRYAAPDNTSFRDTAAKFGFAHQAAARAIFMAANEIVEQVKPTTSFDALRQGRIKANLGQILGY